MSMLVSNIIANYGILLIGNIGACIDNSNPCFRIRVDP